MTEYTIELDCSADIIWMCLSFLTLDIESQVKIIGPLPTQAVLEDSTICLAARQYEHKYNKASLFPWVIQTFEVGWIDEFYPCPLAVELFALAGSMGLAQTYESFVDSEEWHKLRRLAKEALAEAGLPLHPVPVNIDFDDFLEITGRGGYRGQKFLMRLIRWRSRGKA
jgi:hypothetical protein